jgi:diaminopropionate ammonia-lyase
VVGYIVSLLLTVVENDVAPCLLESNRLGKLTTVQGSVLNTGRLDCKEPLLLAFSILQQYADKFMCFSESAATYLNERGVATATFGAVRVAAILMAKQINIRLPDESTFLAIATKTKG